MSKAVKKLRKYFQELQKLEAKEEVVLEKSADLVVLARVAGIKAKVIREYNPELRQSATPSEGSYTLKLPMGKKDRFLTAWNKIPAD